MLLAIQTSTALRKQSSYSWTCGSIRNLLSASSRLLHMTPLRQACATSHSPTPSTAWCRSFGNFLLSTNGGNFSERCCWRLWHPFARQACLDWWSIELNEIQVDQSHCLTQSAKTAKGKQIEGRFFQCLRWMSEMNRAGETRILYISESCPQWLSRERLPSDQWTP